MRALVAVCALATAAPSAAVSPDGVSTPLPVIIGGGNRTLSLTVVRPEALGGPFVIEPQRLGATFTNGAGRSFHLRAAETSPIRSHRESRQWYSVVYHDASMAEIHFPLNASIPPSMYSPKFAANGAVRDGDGNALEITPYVMPGLVYVPPPRPAGGDDANVRALRRTYASKLVYGIGGGIDLSCSRDLDVGLAPTQSARIIAIRRAYGTNGTWAMGGSFGTRGFDTEASFMTLDPILVTVAMPQDAHITGAAITGSPDLERAMSPKSCPRGTLELSDRWEFERMLSLRHPYNQRGWPAAFSRAVAAGAIVKGMTPAMVASVWGYPSAYGTRSEMESRVTWTYAAAAPFEHSVQFSNGRVTAVTLPGQLQ